MSTPNDAPVLAAVAARREAIAEIADFVLAHPELGHEEAETSAYLAGVLETAGFSVQRGVGGLPTAFRAEIKGAAPGRTVGLVAVFDAVPAHLPLEGRTEPQHSCGHSAQAAGVLGAALAFADLRDALEGSVVVIGCPADEIHAPETQRLGSGKALTAARGVWGDVDAAIYAHPEFIDAVWTRSLWMRRETAIVTGTRTLVPGAEAAPIAALRAFAALLPDLDQSQLLVETAVLDGDVEEGSGLSFRAQLLAFSQTEEGIDALLEPVRRALHGAVWERGNSIEAIQPDFAVAEVVLDAFAAAGRPVDTHVPPLPFATDFGNVTRVVPSALIGVGRPGGWAFHTSRGEPEFTGPAGREIAEDIARVLGLAVVRLGRP